MDAQTVSFYEARARDWTAQHRGIPSPALEISHQWLRPGCTILDIGAGSGRDMAALQQADCSAPNQHRRDHAGSGG